MLRKFFKLGPAAEKLVPQASQALYAPYRDEATNTLYRLLFCDDLAAFAARPGIPATSWQNALISSPPDIAALEALATDPATEGRVRYLAFQRLRSAGRAVPPRQLLGVIAEVPLSDGLDTLAAYSDGGVRYLNQTGKIFAADGQSHLQPLVVQLLAAAQPNVDNIGPSNQPRRGALAQGNIRLSFLVSCGLCYGEGDFNLMQRDPFAGPVVARTVALFQAVTSTPAS
jgi:hypothetical protein